MPKAKREKKPKAPGPSVGKVAGRLLSYYFKFYPVKTVFLFVTVLLGALGNVVGMAYIGVVVDQYVVPMLRPPYPDLWGGLAVSMGVMVGVYAVGIFSTFLATRLAVTVGQAIQKKIRDQLFSHMQSLPVRYFDTHNHGDIMSVYTNDVDALREMLSTSVPQLFNSLISMITIFVAMVTLNIFITLFVLLMLAVMLLSVRKVGGGSAKYFMMQQGKIGQVNGYIEELIHGQRVVKVFCHEAEANAAFSKLNEELCASTTKANSYANILMPIINNVGNLQYGLIAVIGGIFAFFGIGNITAGLIAQFLQFSKGFTNPIGQVAQQINAVAMAMAGARRVFALMDETPEEDHGYVTLVNAREENGVLVEARERTGIWAWRHPHRDGSLTYTRLRGEVRMFDVDFGYNPDKLVLKNISLFAEPGQKIAFVGATGAGKTTVTNLINRFYDIADGKIRYDNININKLKKSDLRRSLGVVLQDTHLFTDTILENIRYGRLDATDEEVYAAGRLANADGFIQNLKDGYRTVIQGDGAGLSQGQKQLIAIARAAVADPPVMILDEATSSIDTRTEAIVQAGMDSLMQGRTVFVIAHRLSTIQNADVIMVLERGEIIERGSHDRLIEQKGRYYQLYTGKFS
ncbi:MAG: ABC transporter ATP-binding protein/permease [Clostridiales bacterium]|jgi:ATP-binding cassette subfamily B protein|nr:ABC transporter ATP-binding protein/permease [Clostridiales bacterium]